MRVLVLLSVYLFSQALLAGYSVNQQITMSIGTVSTLVLQPSNSRTYLLFQNAGTSVVAIKVETAQVSTEGVQIPPGGFWEPRYCPQGAIYMRSLSGANDVFILEGR